MSLFVVQKTANHRTSSYLQAQLQQPRALSSLRKATRLIELKKAGKLAVSLSFALPRVHGPWKKPPNVDLVWLSWCFFGHFWPYYLRPLKFMMICLRLLEGKIKLKRRRWSKTLGKHYRDVIFTVIDEIFEVSCFFQQRKVFFDLWSLYDFCSSAGSS